MSGQNTTSLPAPGLALTSSAPVSWLLRRFTGGKSTNRGPQDPRNDETNLSSTLAIPTAREFAPRQEQAGLFVTDELDKAIERCTNKVKRIADDCRRRNRRFRDIEFDLEGDRRRCLWGLDGPDADQDKLTPKDVRRASSVFNEPRFFAEEGRPGRYTVQGGLGNCWFLSALATVSAVPGLMEKICVARDEQVGVYGFIFYMDGGWVDVVIDDMLYSKVPRYEELSDEERGLYQFDQDAYDELGRKGSKTLYFSSSGEENETWVPLIEKAYAKLHGDYAALSGGQATDALEDLTGGVSSACHTADVLDPDRFWTEELRQVGTERLFGCFIYGMNPTEFAEQVQLVNGLIAGHAYSVIAALEVGGKRFVKLRNPWGKTEWSGRWSDGSKEWTSEWLLRLPELGHSFGNDGEFVMEYKDFLKTWTVIGRTRLFDSSWVLSSQWLNVQCRPYPSAWNFGDVTFTISVPDETPAILVIGRANSRAWRELFGPYNWSFDFALYARGGAEPICTASQDILWTRTVTVELAALPAGEYVLQVRLDRTESKPRNFLEEGKLKWDERKLARKWASKAISASNATNFDPLQYEEILPLPASYFTGRDLTEIEIANYTDPGLAGPMSSATRVPDSPSTVIPPVPGPIDASIVLSDEPASIPPALELNGANKDANQQSVFMSELHLENTMPTTNREMSASDTNATLVEDIGLASHAAELDSLNATSDSNHTGFLIAATDEPTTASTAATMHDARDAAIQAAESKEILTAEVVSENDARDTHGEADQEQAGTDKETRTMTIATDGPHSPRGRDHSQIVHSRFGCDICGMTPIVGPRYQCQTTSCTSRDLCTKCVESLSHPSEHSLLRFNATEDNTALSTALRSPTESFRSRPRSPGTPPSPLPAPMPTHDGYTCNVCKDCPIVGSRYRCLDAACRDFDMCERCVEKVDHGEIDAGMNVGLDMHTASHKLLRVSKPESRDYDSDGATENQITLGLRVYTKKHAPATVRGQLRHGKVLRWTRPTV